MELSDSREKGMAIVPKFSAFASICGSIFIVHDILQSHFRNSRKHSSKTSIQNTNSPSKTLRNSAFYRLVLCLSLSDFLASAAMFLTTWPIPHDEFVPGDPNDLVYGNIGNRQTCTAQGFFIQLSIICPMYNALLASYYYLTIRHGWKERDFQARVEYGGQAIVLIWGLGTAVAGLVLEIYNNCSNIWCWIAKYPLECGTDGQVPCEHGEHADVLRWVFYYGPLWISIGVVAGSMSLVYSYVRNLEMKANQYTRKYSSKISRASIASGASSGSNVQGEERNETLDQNKRSRAVAQQGLFYAGSFALVWVFGTINRAMQLAGAKRPWALKFLLAIFEPSQGFFNFLVYVRPRFLRYLQHKKEIRERANDAKRATAMHTVIESTKEIVSDPKQQIDTSGNKHLTIDDDDDDDDRSLYVIRARVVKETNHASRKGYRDRETVQGRRKGVRPACIADDVLSREDRRQSAHLGKQGIKALGLIDGDDLVGELPE